MTTTKKLVVSKAQFGFDITYIRTLLRQAETAVAKNNWKEAEECFQEISACSGTDADMCIENNDGKQKPYKEDIVWEKE
jgi:hypothetical protein